MTDQELLELAAKAAGYAGWKYCEPIPGEPSLYIKDAGGVWMPFFDDADALRLAVKLEMEIYHADDCGMSVFASWPFEGGYNYAIEPHGDDACAATRRAIVRAAALYQIEKERADG